MSTGGTGAPAGIREVVALVEQRDRGAPVEDGRHLTGAEAGVDAGRDRAQARARGVRDRVVDARRHREGDDVAGRDPARRGSSAANESAPRSHCP